MIPKYCPWRWEALAGARGSWDVVFLVKQQRIISAAGSQLAFAFMFRAGSQPMERSPSQAVPLQLT